MNPFSETREFLNLFRTACIWTWRITALITSMRMVDNGSITLPVGMILIAIAWLFSIPYTPTSLP